MVHILKMRGNEMTWEILFETNAISTFIKLFLALICGGILGMERERKNRPAGFRTYMLVCMGATLAMITNEYVSHSFGGGDPTRMGAQVISGIGFLGAGTIIVTGRNKVRGLTTAAGLWASACIGLAIGAGYYEGAIIGSFMSFMAMAFMQRIDNYMISHATEINVYIEFEKFHYLGDFLAYLRENQIKVINMEIIRKDEFGKKGSAGLFCISMERKTSHGEFVKFLCQVEGIIRMEEY